MGGVSVPGVSFLVPAALSSQALTTQTQITRNGVHALQPASVPSPAITGGSWLCDGNNKTFLAAPLIENLPKPSLFIWALLRSHNDAEKVTSNCSKRALLFYSRPLKSPTRLVNPCDDWLPLVVMIPTLKLKANKSALRLAFNQLVSGQFLLFNSSITRTLFIG